MCGVCPNGEESLTYRLTKPTVDGRRQLSLTPLEFGNCSLRCSTSGIHAVVLEKLAVLIPPPRVHRHR